MEGSFHLVADGAGSGRVLPLRTGRGCFILHSDEGRAGYAADRSINVFWVSMYGFGDRESMACRDRWMGFVVIF